MVLWGYESSAGGMVISIPQFRHDFSQLYEGEYVLDAKWQSAITAGPTASITIGFIVGSYLSDMFGRRSVLFIASLFSIPWITVEFIAVTIQVFFVGKILNGFSLGVLSSICSTYVAEVAPLALRGLMSTFLSLSMAVGPFICVLINNTTSTGTNRMAYRESPYCLLFDHHKKEALVNLKRIFDTEDVLPQYALMAVTVEEAKAISSKAGTYLDCFKKKDFRRTWLTAFSFVMQAFSGVAYVSSYSTYYFQLSGFSIQMSFALACIVQALSIAGVITTFFVIDRFGRRFLLVNGMIMLTICNLLVAACGMNTSDKSGLVASSAFLILYCYIYNIGIGPIPYVLGNELPSVFLKAKTLSMGNALNNAVMTMWGAVLPYMFNPDEADMGSKINYIFTALSFISIFVFYFYLPETANRSFEEIDELFALGIPARHWSKYKTEKQILSENAFKDMKGDGVEHKEEVLIENVSTQTFGLNV